MTMIQTLNACFSVSEQILYRGIAMRDAGPTVGNSQSFVRIRRMVKEKGHPFQSAPEQICVARC